MVNVIIIMCYFQPPDPSSPHLQPQQHRDRDHINFLVQADTPYMYFSISALINQVYQWIMFVLHSVWLKCQQLTSMHALKDVMQLAKLMTCN